MTDVPLPDTQTAHGQRTFSSPSVTVISVDLAATHAALDETERITPRLSGDQLARFSELTARNNPDVAHRRAAHIALRIVLERHAGAGVRGASYGVAPGGRPYLAPSETLAHPPHFSLSHAGDFALIAVAHAQPVGVDLETMRAVSIPPERRRRIEAAAQALAPEVPIVGEGDVRFLQAWVRLEAAAKATGEGIGRLLTKAGAVGAGRLADPLDASSRGAAMPVAPGLTVCDILLGNDLFAAVAAAALPPVLAVEALPADVAGLAAFAAGQ